MKDTLYLSRDKCIDSFFEKGTVYTEQTPEAYRLKKYYAANRKLLPDRIDRIQDSVEPAVLAGMNLAVIPGDEMNFRIETPVDLERLKLFINA